MSEIPAAVAGLASLVGLAVFFAAIFALGLAYLAGSLVLMVVGWPVSVVINHSD